MSSPDEDSDASEEAGKVDTAVKQLAERLAPHLNECGVEGFVMCAYITGGDGKVRRVTLGGANPGANPAYADGLRKMETLARVWGLGQL